MKQFLRKYWGEVLVSLVIVIGVLLMLVRVQIYEALIGTLQQLVDSNRAAAARTTGTIDAFIMNVNLYNLAGFVIFLASLIFLLYLLRRRYLKSARWQGDSCPKCKGDIYRVHRTRLDRLWGALLRQPMRRYQCADQVCEWSGLLYGKPHEHHQDTSSSRTFHSSRR